MVRRSAARARVRNSAPMISAVLVACGVVAVVVGAWRGYLAARSALAPLVQPRDETRTLLESGRPMLERPRVRRAIRNVAFSVGWLGVALYGLFLASVGGVLAGR